MKKEIHLIVSNILNQHWTYEQKALIATLAVFLFVSALASYRELFGLLQILGSLLPFSVWKKGTGISIGSLFLTDFDRVRHMHIVGPPGVGKTEFTKLLCFEDIRRKRGCLIIDPKGDRELYDEVKAFCRAEGREADLKLISATYPRESSIWNPCGLGNASELQSKFLNSNIYSEAHYAKACEVGLLRAFNELVSKRPTGFTLPDLVRELKYFAEQHKSKDLDGLFYDFESLSQSEWSEILGCNPRFEPTREISLLDIVQKNMILFIHLPTEGKSIQSSRIGRLLTQELILISGLRKSYPELNQDGEFSIFIDEFDAFATDSFISFLNKGRSSRFMIHIAHQTLSDLKRINAEFAGQIQGNCNIHVIFRQDSPDDAEYWSRFLGTEKTVKRTYQTQDGSTTGASSNREVQEFRFGPDEIKNLKIGQCILSIKTQGKTLGLAKKVKLPLPERYSKNSYISATADLKSKIRGRMAPIYEQTQAEKHQLLSSDQYSPMGRQPSEAFQKTFILPEQDNLKSAAIERWKPTRHNKPNETESNDRGKAKTNNGGSS